MELELGVLCELMLDEDSDVVEPLLKLVSEEELDDDVSNNSEELVVLSKKVELDDKLEEESVLVLKLTVELELLELDVLCSKVEEELKLDSEVLVLEEEDDIVVLNVTSILSINTVLDSIPGSNPNNSTLLRCSKPVNVIFE